MPSIPRPEVIDRYVAGVLALAGVASVIVGDAVPGMPKAPAALLALLITLPVAVRRRWPLAAGLAIVLATNTIFVAGANNYSPPLAIAWMCALYGIAVWTGTRGFLTAVAVMLGSNALSSIGSPATIQDIVFVTVVSVTAMVLVRRTVRERQLLADALAARTALLEREQEARASEAVAEERARIARELHDLVAHNVSVMVVQAGTQRHALADDGSGVRETLMSIEQAGRQALAEARRLLGMLRDGKPQGLEPQPSLNQLDDLVEQVRRAGLPVDVEVEGEHVPLPAGVDLCAYRVVQESLTNALKHAGPAHAAVRLRYAPGALGIEVRDDGAGTRNGNGDGAGHGLVGMRERVALYGGTLRAGPHQDGGFEVRAELPLT